MQLMSDHDDDASENVDWVWEATEAEFRKLDEQITSEVLHDKAQLRALFVGLIERCQVLAREHAPRYDEMTFYNGTFTEYEYVSAATSEDLALIMQAAEAAEFGA